MLIYIWSRMVLCQINVDWMESASHVENNWFRCNLLRLGEQCSFFLLVQTVHCTCQGKNAVINFHRPTLLKSKEYNDENTSSSVHTLELGLKSQNEYPNVFFVRQVWDAIVDRMNQELVEMFCNNCSSQPTWNGFRFDNNQFEIKRIQRQTFC